MSRFELGTIVTITKASALEDHEVIAYREKVKSSVIGEIEKGDTNKRKERI